MPPHRLRTLYCSKLQCGNKGCPLGRDPHCNFEYHPMFNNTLQHIVKMTNISDNEHLSIHTNTQAIGVKQSNTLVHDHLFFLLLLSHATRSNLECSLLLHAPKKQQLMLIYRYLTITCNCWFYIIINYTTPLANTLHHCLHIILCLSPSCWPCLSHTSEPGVQARCTFL